VDVFARKLTPGLADKFGQSVVVENRPGGNSAIGAREAARSAPDGHTLFHANINNSLNDILTNDACCRLNEALVPVTLLTSTPLVMVAHPSLGVKTWKEYLALAKSQPQLLTFASGGTGSITQLLGVKINMMAGLGVREIPYKAIGAELPDLMAGHENHSARHFSIQARRQDSRKAPIHLFIFRHYIDALVACVRASLAAASARRVRIKASATRSPRADASLS
jgi:tripartite-type tricarboxylate transporter receptor subunit TctC